VNRFIGFLNLRYDGAYPKCFPGPTMKKVMDDMNLIKFGNNDTAAIYDRTTMELVAFGVRSGEWVDCQV